MTFALAVRSFYEDRSVPKRDAVEEPDSLLAGEVTSLIEDACIRVRGQVEHKYVGVGKVSGKDFESYFRVIRELLIDRFVHHDGDSRSLFTRLGNELPALTKESYLGSHRSRLEYLARLTEERVTRDLRKRV